jgi:hypothetical protein
VQLYGGMWRCECSFMAECGDDLSAALWWNVAMFGVQLYGGMWQCTEYSMACGENFEYLVSKRSSPYLYVHYIYMWLFLRRASGRRLRVFLMKVDCFEAETSVDTQNKIICFINKPKSIWHAFGIRPHSVNTKWRCVLITKWRRNA